MSRSKMQIRCDKENNKIEIYRDIKEAAAAVDTNMENWKVQLLIIDAINKGKKAFKCKWSTVEIRD